MYARGSCRPQAMQPGSTGESRRGPICVPGVRPVPARSMSSQRAGARLPLIHAIISAMAALTTSPLRCTTDGLFVPVAVAVFAVEPLLLGGFCPAADLGGVELIQAH